MSFWDKLLGKLVFGRSRLNSSVFEKLLISYSCISLMKYCALRSFCIKLLCFQKFKFSRFSIDRICCSTNRNCDKNFGLNLLSSIGAQLIEFNFWSIEAKFRPIKIRSVNVLKRVLSRVLHTIQTFSNTSLTIFLDQSNLKQFLSFSSTNLSRVFVFKLKQVSFTLYFSLKSHFSCIFMHFHWKFSNKELFGFEIISVVFNQNKSMGFCC